MSLAIRRDPDRLMRRHLVAAAREGSARSDHPAPTQTARRLEQRLHSQRIDPVVVGQDENRLIVVCHCHPLAHPAHRIG
jgi:hypothetical protein